MNALPLDLLPAWAPNLHPLVVHFPIALLLVAVAADLVALAWARAIWASTVASCLYPTGVAAAVVAYLTGRRAAASVLVPGMAHAVVLEHWNWALATVICFAAITLARLAFNLGGVRPPGWARATIAVLGVVGALLLFHTGEQGGRLVFQHGVGISPSAQR